MKSWLIGKDFDVGKDWRQEKGTTEDESWLDTPPTQWRWVWVNSGSWWWTGRPGVQWFMGSQRVGHDWATELKWTEPDHQNSESSRKISTLASLTMPKPLTVRTTTNCGKFLERWEHQITWRASWEICIQVKKQQNWTWNNRLVPNRERSTSRLHIATLLI